MPGSRRADQADQGEDVTVKLVPPKRAGADALPRSRAPVRASTGR